MAALGLDDTHGILRRPSVERLAHSGGLGWSSAFAATLKETPYEASFPAVPSHLIILHLDGPVTIDRWIGGSGQSHVVPPGGTFMMPGGVDFRVRLGGALSTVHLYLQPHILAEVALGLGEDASCRDLAPRLSERDPLLERLVLGVRDELLDPGLMGDGYIDYLARAVAARIIRTATRGGSPTPQIKGHGPNAAKFARALDYLDAHLHRTVRLHDLAALLAMSESQLIAFFKNTTGMPPHRYIMAMRVARARASLESGRLPLADVALSCGFSHQEHMTRVFKRETKMTPGAYRRSFR
jgi:AraC family transcriptional regulator